MADLGRGARGARYPLKKKKKKKKKEREREREREREEEEEEEEEEKKKKKKHVDELKSDPFEDTGVDVDGR